MYLSCGRSAGIIFDPIHDAHVFFKVSYMCVIAGKILLVKDFDLMNWSLLSIHAWYSLRHFGTVRNGYCTKLVGPWTQYRNDAGTMFGNIYCDTTLDSEFGILVQNLDGKRGRTLSCSLVFSVCCNVWLRKYLLSLLMKCLNEGLFWEYDRISQ